MDSEEELTVWCGNLPTEIDEELLYELFLQVAPLKKIRLLNDTKTGRQGKYGFVTFKHEASVQYAIQSLNGTRLYDRSIVVRSRNAPQGSVSQPHPHLQSGPDAGAKNNRNSNPRNYPMARAGRNSFKDEKRNNYHNYNNHNRYEHNESYGRSRRRH